MRVLALLLLVGCSPPSADTNISSPPLPLDPELAKGCPAAHGTVGLEVGHTFPSLRLRNAQWDGVTTEEMCGRHAMIIVSATEWCSSCITEMYMLAAVSNEWKSRGVEIYYTLFEDYARQPPTRYTLWRNEDRLYDAFGEVSYSILADPLAHLPSAVSEQHGRILLPLVWALDSDMKVQKFDQGVSFTETEAWVEEILQPMASPIF